mmetsp:Transcript_84319/g.219456  ORF Transcript_84319/g.219456 Transcript_84319/m.219456 type:complete len:421 (-) Transcript_84319:2863-4125(-)
MQGPPVSVARQGRPIVFRLIHVILGAEHRTHLPAPVLACCATLVLRPLAAREGQLHHDDKETPELVCLGVIDFVVRAAAARCVCDSDTPRVLGLQADSLRGEEQVVLVVHPAALPLGEGEVPHDVPFFHAAAPLGFLSKLLHNILGLLGTAGDDQYRHMATSTEGKLPHALQLRSLVWKHFDRLLWEVLLLHIYRLGPRQTWSGPLRRMKSFPCLDLTSSQELRHVQEGAFVRVLQKLFFFIISKRSRESKDTAIPTKDQGLGHDEERLEPLHRKGPSHHIWFSDPKAMGKSQDLELGRLLRFVWQARLRIFCDPTCIIDVCAWEEVGRFACFHCPLYLLRLLPLLLHDLVHALLFVKLLLASLWRQVLELSILQVQCNSDLHRIFTEALVVVNHHIGWAPVNHQGVNLINQKDTVLEVV